MTGNRAVTYQGPMKVLVENIDYPTFELKDGPGVNPANVGRKVPHGAILKVVTTNICGSDQHMVRGRTTAPEGLVLGHEITGEVSRSAPASNSSRSATSVRCRSTSPAAAVRTAKKARPVSV